MKSSTPNRGPYRRRLAVILLCGLSTMIGLAGCSTTNSTTKNSGDPLLGDPMTPPKGPPGTTAGLFKPAAPRDGNTPAALVGHTEVPGLKGATPLSLDPGWQRDYKSGGPKVTPVPLEKSSTPPTLIPTSGTWTNPEALASAPKVTPLAPLGSDPLAPLQALGAVGVRYEASAKGVELSCFVPGGGPGNLRYVETVAPTLPQAVEAIVQQVR